MRKSAFVAIFGVCFGTYCQAQTQAPVSTLRTDVRLVTVDVSVQGKKGVNIHGLTCADFLLEEANTSQRLKTCEEHSFSPAAVSSAPELVSGVSNVFTNASAQALPPTLDIVLVDFLNAGRENLGKLTDEMRSILRTRRSGHRTAVMVLGEDLSLVVGFTDDASLEAESARLPQTVGALGAAPADTDGGPRAGTVLSGAYAASVQTRRIELTLDALRSIDTYVAGLPGRKNLFWITSSFPLTFAGGSVTGSVTTDREDLSDEMKKIGGQLALDRIAVFPVHVDGVVNQAVVTAEVGSRAVRSDPTHYSALTQAGSDTISAQHGTMNQIAEQTGGQAFYGDNNIDRMLNKAFAASTDYYTLTYIPVGMRTDGSFRAFMIKSRAEGVHLTYPRGYFATDPAKAKAERETAASDKGASGPMTLAENSTFPPAIWRRVSYSMTRGLPAANGVFFGVQVKPMGDATPGPDVEAKGKKKSDDPQRHLELDYRVQGGDLTWTNNSEGAATDIHVMLVAFDSRNRVLTETDRPIHLQYTAEQFAALKSTAVSLKQVVEVPASGRIFLRVGVLDIGSNHLGTVEIPTSKLRFAGTPETTQAVQPKDGVSPR